MESCLATETAPGDLWMMSTTMTTTMTTATTWRRPWAAAAAAMATVLKIPPHPSSHHAQALGRAGGKLPAWEPAPSPEAHSQTLALLFRDCRRVAAAEHDVAGRPRACAALLGDGLCAAATALALHPRCSLAHTWLAYCANAAMPLALLARVGDAARRRAAALETKRAPEADGPSAGSGGGPAAGACEEGDSVRAASARAGPISQAIAAGAFARRVAAAAWESATGRVAAATEAVRGVDLGLERAGTSSRAASVARLHAACAVDLDPLDARALHLLGRAYLEASQAPTSWRVAAWASSAPIPRPSVLDALGALLRAEHAWASLHSGAPWPANLLAQAQAHLAAGDRAAATNCLALCIDLGSAAHADAESAEAAAEAAALRRDEGLV
mmetsp:Transcript_3987/g.16627  ORF Transcript_3987/g.16627 Transcript_3987/m.16627 type:complete len:386 (+) Transcript_3987:2096-3253(+)